MRLSGKGFLFSGILSLITTACLPLVVLAQTAELPQTFDNYPFPPNGWSAPVSADGFTPEGERRWYRSDTTFFSDDTSGLEPGRGESGHSAVHNTFEIFGATVDLIASNIDFSGYATATLHFYVRNKDGDDNVTVWVDSGQGFVNKSVNVNGYGGSGSTGGNDFDWTEYTINLDFYCTVTNTSTAIRFRVSGSTGNSNLGLDDVSLSTTAIPVQLASFSATANRAAAELKWSTATEVNNYGFEVQRRWIQGSGFTENHVPSTLILEPNWTTIGFVAGSGTSTSQREYSYIDANLPSGRYG
ncbi:MAG: hypothetical protein HY562_00610, partial [Ignavibacteriales bacterium]|nr:hypothetical protein [Ignavibacteriales bacterium]